MSQRKGATHTKKHQQGRKITYVVELIVPDKEAGEFCGKITAALGLCRFTIMNLNNNEVIQASAPRSFRAGKKKEIINVDDIVLVQPGISKNQYFITHLYSSADITELNRQCIIGHIKKNNTISIEPETVEEEVSEPLALEDIWNDL